MRSAKTVLHCDRIVSDISDGRWLTRHSETPYFRPSLAIREIDRRVGSKPRLSSAIAPQAEIEDEATEQRDHDVDDFRGDDRDVEDGDRLALDRDSQQARQDVGHVVAQGEAGEHEGIAPIVAQILDRGEQAEIGQRIVRLVEAAHRLGNALDERGEAVGHWRVDGDERVLPALADEVAAGLNDQILENAGLAAAADRIAAA
jgi:hypothetical protein